MRSWLSRQISNIRQVSERWQVERERVPFTGRTLAGPSVTPDTALTVSAVWACVRYLSQNVALHPWRVMRDGVHGGEVVASHPIDWLVSRRASVESSSFQFRETLMSWALRWGNGYAEIERDAVGRPFALWPIHPSRVCVYRDPQSLKLYYQIDSGAVNGSRGVAGTVLDPEDMFHVRGFGEDVVGVSVMAYAAQSIGWARAAQIFGASFFGNGMNMAGVVTSKKKLSPESFNRLKAEFDSIYRGVLNANKTAVLDVDLDWKSVAIDPEKAQFIVANQFLVEEICRWFGVPPHKVQHLLRGTFSNIEHQSIEVVLDSIAPWAKRFEDEADAKFFGQNRQNLYTRIDFSTLLKGDALSRAQRYQLMRNMGVYSANDILRQEGENTIGPAGEERIVQSQYIPLSQVGQVPSAPKPPDRAAMLARLEKLRAA